MTIAACSIDGKMPDEKPLLRCGFIGVSRRAEGMLEWWGGRWWTGWGCGRARRTGSSGRTDS